MFLDKCTPHLVNRLGRRVANGFDVKPHWNVATSTAFTRIVQINATDNGQVAVRSERSQTVERDTDGGVRGDVWLRFVIIQVSSLKQAKRIATTPTRLVNTQKGTHVSVLFLTGL